MAGEPTSTAVHRATFKHFVKENFSLRSSVLLAGPVAHHRLNAKHGDLRPAARVMCYMSLSIENKHTGIVQVGFVSPMRLGDHAKG